MAIILSAYEYICGGCGADLGLMKKLSSSLGKKKVYEKVRPTIKAIVIVMAARLAELHLTMIRSFKSQVAFFQKKWSSIRAYVIAFCFRKSIWKTKRAS